MLTDRLVHLAKPRPRRRQLTPAREQHSDATAPLAPARGILLGVVLGVVSWGMLLWVVVAIGGRLF